MRAAGAKAKEVDALMDHMAAGDLQEQQEQHQDPPSLLDPTPDGLLNATPRANAAPPRLLTPPLVPLTLYYTVVAKIVRQNKQLQYNELYAQARKSNLQRVVGEMRQSCS
jgi:predicted nucleic acid-binding OB-fold protein